MANEKSVGVVTLRNGLNRESLRIVGNRKSSSGVAPQGGGCEEGEKMATGQCTVCLSPGYVTENMTMLYE